VVPGVLLTINVSGQKTDFLNTDFSKADSVAARYPAHSLTDLKDLTIKLTESLPSDELKFRSIYKWISENVENDYALYLKTQRKRTTIKDSVEYRKWQRDFMRDLFQSLQTHRRTICTGYAYLLKELAFHAGIECKVIQGYGRTAAANIGGEGVANHSWNAVKLNNKWYLCDATWSSGAVDQSSGAFIKKYDDSYFLADPVLFVRNHYPIDAAWMLISERPTLNDFLNGPLTYTPIYKYQIKKIFPETFRSTIKRKEPMTFQVSKGSPMPAAAELQISHNGNVEIFHPKIYRSQAGDFCVDHTFNSRGKYVVHLLLENEFIFTCTVEVQ